MYIGYVRDMLFHDTGALQNSEGRVIFKGFWKKGYPIKGDQYFETGIKGKSYSGTYKYGIPNGFGTYYYQGMDEKAKYIGQVKDDMAEGKGISLTIHGTKLHEGYYKKGLPNGKGILYYPNGMVKYEGYFKDGKFDGEGILYYENVIQQSKVTLNGNYAEDGSFRGQGFKLYDIRQVHYKGKFRYGKFHGKGTLYSKTLDPKEIERIKTNRRMGAFKGTETVFGKAIYSGPFVDGQPQTALVS